MYEKFFNLLGILAPPSNIIVGIWSLVILAGCAYSIFSTKQVSTPIAVIFSAVLTNFTANKISKSLNESTASKDVNPDIQ